MRAILVRASQVFDLAPSSLVTRHLGKAAALTAALLWPRITCAASKPNCLRSSVAAECRN